MASDDRYTSQALSKAEGINQYVAYQDADDRIEQTFGELRILQHGQNFDMVQFEDRASELMSLAMIHARHPDWKKGTRRLSGMCFDHVNPKTILGKTMDDSPFNLAAVSLPSCWYLGGVDAKQILNASQVFEAASTDWATIAAERHGADGATPDMLRPKGDYVGVDDKDEPNQAAQRLPPQEDEEEWLSWLDLEDDLEDAAEGGSDSADAAQGGSDSAARGQSSIHVDGSSARRRTLKYPHPDFPNGITASKDVGLLWSTKQRRSVERINRVQQRPKAGTSESAQSWTDERAEILAHVTPLLAIFDSPFGATMVVVMPEKFDLADFKGIDCVAASDLLLENTIIYAKVMKPDPLSAGASDFVFRNHNLTETVKVSSLLVRPCDPGTAILEDGRVEWQFSIFSLEVLMTLNWTDVEKNFYRQGQTRKEGQKLLPMLKADTVYVDGSQAPRLIVYGTGRAATDPQHSTRASSASEIQVTCELCGAIRSSAEIQQHIGAHLLEEDWSRYKKTKPAFPCGLCGVRDVVGQWLLDPLSFAGCSVSISDDGRRARHQCKLAGEVSYSLATAAKSSWSTRPCTNRPMKCGACPLFIQTYSMADHYRNKHPGLGMGADMQKLVQLRAHEREYTLQLIDKMTIRTKIVCSDRNCECLKSGN
jgi:hypothetical protein